jgi:AraC-like DNA-binding protein
VPNSATTHDHVQRMLSEIRQNYSQRLTLATLARLLRRQSAYLGRLFRAEIGITVHEYVTRARMVFGGAHVRAGVKIEAVALDLGYRSKKNFYRQFKRFFGMTPEAYRHGHDGSAADDPRQDNRRLCVQDRQVQAPDLSAPGRRPARVTAGRTTDRTAFVPSSGRPKMPPRRAGSRVAVLLTDDRGCYVGATESAVALTGYSIDELRGMPTEELFPTGSDLKTKCRLQMFLPASPSLPSTTVLHTKSAGGVLVHLTSIENLLGERHPLTPRRSRKATVRPEPQRRSVRQKVGAAPASRSPRV